MECPNCKEDSGIILYRDLITCNNCEEVLHIDYCVCHKCNYSWRMNGDCFMDGGLIEPEGLQEAFEQLDGLAKEPISGDLISDMIHRCIKCGELVIRNKNVFECFACGFKWEVISTLEE